MEEKIRELIAEANMHTFQNNNYLFPGIGIYSRPSIDMQAWIAESEDFILTKYGTDSAPWRIFERFNINRLEGNNEEDLEREKGIIVSALTACLRISPKQKEKQGIVTKELDLTKAFIVHGHDDLLKTEVARFLEKLGIKPIILHEQASSGTTIIEKIEKYSNVGFGVVLYTACDIGGKNGETPVLQKRARQNVVFEHGFLIGKIGRQNVCAIVKGDIETPNDISGVVYISVENEWKLSLAKELRSSGYEIDMNLVV